MARNVTTGLLVVGAFVAGMLTPGLRAQPGGIPGTGEYIVVNYMKVPAGKGPEYVAFEQDFAKAAHQARVRDGKMKSWSLWQKRFGGTDDGFSFATVNTFSRFEDIEGAGVSDYMQKANPGKSAAEIQRLTQESREIVRTDVWRVVDQTR